MGEGGSKVWLSADLLNVSGCPARLRREDVELAQQHGLADSAKPVVDETSIGSARTERRHEGLEVLEVFVAPREMRRSSSGAWGVGVVSAEHATSLKLSKKQ